MISIYKDEMLDLLYPGKGIVSKKHNQYIEIKEQRIWKAVEIKKLRKYLHLSQALFAALLGVNINTVISWENGRNAPSQIASRMMEILNKYPDCVLEAGIVKFKG